MSKKQTTYTDGVKGLYAQFYYSQFFSRSDSILHHTAAGIENKNLALGNDRDTGTSTIRIGYRCASAQHEYPGAIFSRNGKRQ